MAYLAVISTYIECLVKITGWNFNTLRFEIRQKKCEVLFAAGHMEGAVISILEMDISAETNSKEEMKWLIGKDVFLCSAPLVIDFSRRL